MLHPGSIRCEHGAALVVSLLLLATIPQGQTRMRTAAVSGLGAGGRGCFALDITEPSTFQEDIRAASGTVLWEFTATDDPDLG